MFKYRVGLAVNYNEDDPLCISALPHISKDPKKTDVDRDANSDLSLNVEMPGISEILT